MIISRCRSLAALVLCASIITSEGLPIAADLPHIPPEHAPAPRPAQILIIDSTSARSSSGGTVTITTSHVI